MASKPSADEAPALATSASMPAAPAAAAAAVAAAAAAPVVALNSGTTRTREYPFGNDGPAPMVKKRRTKNYKLREDMVKSRPTMTVRVAPFEPRTFSTWDQFIQAWGEYMTRTKTLYRRRSSSTTKYWNTKHKFKKYPIPETFQYATMAYWCTHGCIQPSRSNGVRTHLHNRYTGCTARITADVICEPIEGTEEVRWFVRVRNQIAQHNHRINDEIHSCYTNNSSVPDELLLGSREAAAEEEAGACGEPNAQAGSPSRMMRNFDSEEPEFESSGRMMVDLDSQIGVDADSGFSRSPSASGLPASAAQTPSSAPKASNKPSSSVSGSPSAPPALVLREVLAEEQKVNMATSELYPLVTELKRTTSRVIHKRLQDVSEMVAHLLAKWHQDRVAEEAASQGIITAPVVTTPNEHSTASSSGAATSKPPAPTATISTITGLPAGASFFLAPRGEHLQSEATHATALSVSNDSGSCDEVGEAQAGRAETSMLGNQRGPSEAV